MAEKHNYKFMQEIFIIESISVSFGDQRPIELTFDFDDDSSNYYHTLIIGRNGVCKSSLLKAIILFLVRAQSRGFLVRFKNYVEIMRMDYRLGDDNYSISYPDTQIQYFKNGVECDFMEMKFPMIVASTMSMFDKFPVNRMSQNSTRSIYSYDKYRYVGPKAGNNIFMSKTNVLLEPLSLIGKSTEIKKYEDIGRILNYVGYKEKISIEASLRDKTSSLRRAVTAYEPLTKDEELMLSYKMKDGDSISFDINFTSYNHLPDIESVELIRTLRRKRYIKDVHCYCYTHCGRKVDVNNLSSGEFNLLSLMMNIIMTGDGRPLLLLFDEPEVSQHPNWQIDIIKMLEDVLMDYNCHIITATHSHFLVSNLPMQKSNVIRIEKDADEVIYAENIDADTYGWSSEEVLLKVFNMATDRSRYLAQIVGELLQAIGQNSIGIDDVKSKLAFLKQVSLNLSDVDPMKKVISSIVSEFNS